MVLESPYLKTSVVPGAQNPFIVGSVEDHTCHLTMDTGSNISSILPDVLSKQKQTLIQPVSHSIHTVTGEKVLETAGDRTPMESTSYVPPPTDMDTLYEPSRTYGSKRGAVKQTRTIIHALPPRLNDSWICILIGIFLHAPIIFLLYDCVVHLE